MAGYNYHEGMSNNAVSAYNMGIKPISKFTPQDLKPFGITVKFAKWLAKNDYWKPCEYHHSGGTWYNKVNFFDTEDLKDIEGIKALMCKYKDEMDKNVEEIRVKGEYAIWGGSRRRPKFEGYKQFTGALKDNWIYLDDGGKKKATGNHIKYEKIDNFCEKESYNG